MALAVAGLLAGGPARAQDEYVPENVEPPTPAPVKPAPTPQNLPLPEPTGADTVAVLQGLDKVTARTSTIEAPLNEVAHFGTLEIVPHACFKNPPEEEPEAAAFLDISEEKPGEPRTQLFLGWMFASSPALSALEHPVYDVWVLDCKTESKAPSGNSR